MKICSACKIEKVETEFVKHSTAKNGLSPHCKSCRKIEHRADYLKNKGRVKETSRIYREENKEKVAIAKKRYWEAHKDETNATVKRYRERNSEACKMRITLNRKKCESLWKQILKDKNMDYCIRCGYDNFFEALDYHHLIPSTKKDRISMLMRRPPTLERLVELEKVVCLCSNCHRELHCGRWTIEEAIYQLATGAKGAPSSPAPPSPGAPPSNQAGMPQGQGEQQARAAAPQQVQ